MPVSPGPSIHDLRIDRDRRRPRRALTAGVLATVIVALSGVAAWWQVGRTRSDPVPAAAITKGARSSSSGVLNASGYVTARRRATVSSRITGRIEEILVEEGMRVTTGQVLARLDAAPLRASLRLSEAQLESSRRLLDETEVRLNEASLQLARMQRLAGQGIAGQADLDAAQAQHDSLAARLAAGREQVAVAERQVAVQRIELRETVIVAPFDGVAISKDAQAGEMVSPQSAGGGFTRTGICTLVDMTSLEVEVDVSESFINRVHPGQRATARLDAYPDWQIPMRVITIVPTADRQRATVLVRLGFDSLDPRILPDMGVKVVFLEERSETQPATSSRVVVPRNAVRREGSTDIVFVVRDQTIERRGVRLGAIDDTTVQVLAGLVAGERVVVEPSAALRDGAHVNVKE